MKEKFRFAVFIGKDKDGYFAICPELQGCYSQGRTYEEALANIGDAVRLHIGDRIANGEKISQSELSSVAQIEVAI